ncbi:MAG TPA: hypothetical protein VH108_07735 [Gaiellaceae bacterium]|jgi:hypothetical protein|nr:hypothetical protein [Gaiellaceae bacterium]
MEERSGVTGGVLARLERIEALRAGGPASELLAELRALVPEAEAWARAEGDARARAAASKLREEAEGMS